MDQKPAEFYKKALKQYYIVMDDGVVPEIFAKAYGEEESNILALCRIFDIIHNLQDAFKVGMLNSLVDIAIETTLKIAYHNYNLRTQKGER